MVPEGWHVKSVGDICTLINGHGFKSKDWSDSGLPIIRIQNLNGSESFNFYDGAIKKQWLVNPGDILFAWAGTKGVSFGAKLWKGPKGVLNQHIFRVEPKLKVDHTWLYFAMLSVTKRVEEKAHGFKSTLVHVQKSDVTEQVVLVPPLDEQKKIAQVIYTWDEAVRTCERLLSNSRQQKRGLLQQLLNGKRRFNSESGRGFPAWKEEKVGNFLRLHKEYVPASTKLPILTSSRDGLYEQERSVINEGKYGVIPFGYFTYRHMSDDLIFKFNLNREWEKGAISKEYPVFSASGVDKDFLEAQLNHGDAFKRFAIQQKQGGTRTRLYFRNLCEFRFAIPCLEEQEKIATALSVANQEIEVVKKKVECIKHERNALMQQLLTGKRRVGSGDFQCEKVGEV